MVEKTSEAATRFKTSMQIGFVLGKGQVLRHTEKVESSSSLANRTEATHCSTQVSKIKVAFLVKVE